jgi:hypothetical protein
MAVCALSLIGAAESAALSDQQIAELQASFDVRARAAMEFCLQEMTANPVSSENQYKYTLGALPGLYLGKHLEQANRAVIGLCDFTEATETGMNDMYWWGNHLCRIYNMFGSRSGQYPGRLSEEAERRIVQLLWKWASRDLEENASPVAEWADPAKVWDIWFSENHEIMRNSTAWGAAQILSRVDGYKDRVYADGLTAAQHYAQWTEYFKKYLISRGRNGLFVETSSPGYSKWTLHCIYNLYDFAEDQRLKQLAGNLLDLWWADWACDQIGGVHGGVKSRVYEGHNSQLDAIQTGYTLGWYYTGLGQDMSRPYPPEVGRGMPLKHAAFCAATSAYRMPDAVLALAVDSAGKGVYEHVSCRPGRNRLPPKALFLDDLTRHNKVKPVFYISDTEPGSVHYSYVTPDYMMASYYWPMMPEYRIAAIHSQSRWQGITFAGAVNARIFPQCAAAQVCGSHLVNYNEHRSVQYKNTLIVQKLSTSLYALDMRVFFSTSGLKRTERDGWIFVEGPQAYAAIKVVSGSYVWDDSNWMRCVNSYSPVVFETARKSDHNGFEAFQCAVVERPLLFDGKVLNYDGLSGRRLTLHVNSDQSPEINGVPLEYNPPFVFAGDFVKQSREAGRVVITYGKYTHAVEFND